MLGALGDDHGGAVLAEPVHVGEPDPHRRLAVLEPAEHVGGGEVGAAHLDPVALRVADERRRRIEAHRLRVQERAEERRGTVVRLSQDDW